MGKPINDDATAYLRALVEDEAEPVAFEEFFHFTVEHGTDALDDLIRRMKEK